MGRISNFKRKQVSHRHFGLCLELHKKQNKLTHYMPVTLTFSRLEFAWNTICIFNILFMNTCHNKLMSGISETKCQERKIIIFLLVQLQ